MGVHRFGLLFREDRVRFGAGRMGRVLDGNGDPHSCGTGFWFLNTLIFPPWEVCFLGGQERELYPLGHAEFPAQLHPRRRLCSATLDSRVFRWTGGHFRALLGI